MADITMCQTLDCPLRFGCYRTTAWPNHFRQSYFSVPPVVYNSDGKAECDYFIPTGGQTYGPKDVSAV